MAAMILAPFEGYVSESWSEFTLLLAVFDMVLPCLAGTLSPCEGVENARGLALSEQMDLASCVNAKNDELDGASAASGAGSVNDLFKELAAQVRRHANLLDCVMSQVLKSSRYLLCPLEISFPCPGLIKLDMLTLTSTMVCAFLVLERS